MRDWLLAHSWILWILAGVFWLGGSTLILMNNAVLGGALIAFAAVVLLGYSSMLKRRDQQATSGASDGPSIFDIFGP